MKKIIAFLFAMLLLAGLLTACGGGNDAPVETAEPEVEEPALENEEPAEPEDGEADETEDEEPLLAIDPSLVGIWLWDEHGAYEYNFFEDGTGTRGAELIDYITEFTWLITEDLYLVIETEAMTERWDYHIQNDSLTLTSRQVPGTQYSYTRLSMSPR